MNNELKICDEIHPTLEEITTLLESKKVNYFLGVVDHSATDLHEGKVYVRSDVKGEDMCHILGSAFKTRQDIINLGIWIGEVILAGNNTNEKKKSSTKRSGTTGRKKRLPEENQPM